MLTGVRNGGFSVTVDQRQKGAPPSATPRLSQAHPPGTLIGNLLELFNRNATGVSILVRQTLENEENFADAVAALSKQPVIAPVYYIVSGVSGNDGAVVTRDRHAAPPGMTLSVSH